MSGSSGVVGVVGVREWCGWLDAFGARLYRGSWIRADALKKAMPCHNLAGAGF